MEEYVCAGCGSCIEPSKGVRVVGTDLYFHRPSTVLSIYDTGAMWPFFADCATVYIMLNPESGSVNREVENIQ